MYQNDLTRLLHGYALPQALLDELDTLLRLAATGRPPVLATLDASPPSVMLQGRQKEASRRDTSHEPDIASATAQLPLGTYEDLGLLGVGAMGEVRRVCDTDLNRIMAMKVIRPQLMCRPAAVARFIEEAQVTAQLRHPGIVPVHELGRLPNGSLFFTMQEVDGRTLSVVIDEVHRNDRQPGQSGQNTWCLRRLVEAFHRVCEAVAYAHERGVVHRDLKPSNVMLGEHGAVRVMDWGLAKVVGRPDLAAASGELDPIVTDRSQDPVLATRTGAVAGTPAYMAPEQARGDVASIDVRSDVYALGAILYQLLSGRPPYTGTDACDVLAQVISGPPVSPGPLSDNSLTLPWGWGAGDSAEAQSQPLPVELVRICQKAMSRQPGNRYATASLVAAAIEAWLDGTRRRERALELVAAAAVKQGEERAIRDRAIALLREAQEQLAGVEDWRPDEERFAAWAMEDEAKELTKQAVHVDHEQERLLYAALSHAPALVEAHEALASRYRSKHEKREHELREATREAVLLGSHASVLSSERADRHGHFAYLRGDGALSLKTDPPGAEVLLHRYEMKNRRLEPVFLRSLGLTPLSEVPLPMGSYLCEIKRVDGAGPPVQYPVHIGRREHWDGVPPGAQEPQEVWLPTHGDLGPLDCYVPAGWFWFSGATAVGGAARHRTWCDGLVVRKFPVTNLEYLAFLNDLVTQGQEEEALRHGPRNRENAAGAPGRMLWNYEGGRFRLGTDAEGDEWLPDYPVLMLSLHNVSAYIAWLAARECLPWRLPMSLEWDKAARGVDGRPFPWGHHMSAAMCCVKTSHSGRPLPAVVDSYPLDVGPYGVRGMAGNVTDRCGEIMLTFDAPKVTRVEVQTEKHASVAYRISRGNSWFSPNPAAGLLRGRNAPGDRNDGLGFRCVRSVSRSRSDS